jgi:hypothetical protein
MALPSQSSKFFPNDFNHIHLIEFVARECARHSGSRNGPNSAWLFTAFAMHTARQEPHSHSGRWNSVMKTDNGLFGIIIGGLVAVAAAIFIFSGGELGGKKTVEGDQDLPPIASTDK